MKLIIEGEFGTPVVFVRHKWNKYSKPDDPTKYYTMREIAELAQALFGDKYTFRYEIPQEEDQLLLFYS